MKRTIAGGLLVLGLSGLGGCGGEKPVDPKNLPPLTAEQLAEIKKQDDAVADEEGKSVRAEAPAATAKKGKKASRVAADEG